MGRHSRGKKALLYLSKMVSARCSPEGPTENLR